MEAVGGVSRARGWCGLLGEDGVIFAFCVVVLFCYVGRNGLVGEVQR